VPEIYDGTVVIKQAVRAPGERAKVAVASRERDVDPVGACVGMKGSRVQSIIRELRGEKIDIIEWSDDLVTFAQSALAPAKITRVSVTHQGEVPHLDVIVEDEQLSLAIGKRGQNVRLASELIGARIDIKSESDVKDEVADALAKMLQVGLAPSETPIELTEIEGVDDQLATRLEEAGFGHLEKLTAATTEELIAVAGVDAALAATLKTWADAQSAALAEAAQAEERIETTSTMDDSDFMAALSKAFQESAQEEAASSPDSDLDALAAALSGAIEADEVAPETDDTAPAEEAEDAAEEPDEQGS
jgi:N utilization substance protein A